MMGEITYSLAKKVAAKSEDVRRLNDLIDNMQVPHVHSLSIWSYVMMYAVVFWKQKVAEMPKILKAPRAGR